MDKDVRIRELEAEVAGLKRLLAGALGRIARLEKNSSTSSKPPSSDITRPPKADGAGPPGKTKRKRGGQKGHARNLREPVASERVDEAFEYDFAPGTTPGDGWEPLDTWHVVQQVELRESPLIVTEHRFRQYRHKRTGRIIHAPVPGDLRQQGLFGPRLRALTATLKGELHASYRGIARLYEDALGLAISTGYLAKVIGQTSDALASPYKQLCAALPGEPVLNLDETGHPDRGDRLWLWGAVAKHFTVFKIAAHRSAKVIEGLLGLAYAGVIGCDFFGAYRKFLKDAGDAGGDCSAAFCWAHLIRDVRFLTTLGDKVIVRWATKLLDAIRRLFKAYHTQGERSQQNAKVRVLKCVRRPPNRGEVRTLAKRIREHARAYFLFLERDDVEPTNNAAERALRHAVIGRKLTQGTRGDTGQRWCERMLSVRATCQQQDRSFFNYLVQAITEHTHGRKPSPLLT